MQGVYQIKIFLSIAQISPLTKGILLSAYEFLIIFSDCQTPEILHFYRYLYTLYTDTLHVFKF
jgi:hypothetical protein